MRTFPVCVYQARAYPLDGVGLCKWENRYISVLDLFFATIPSMFTTTELVLYFCLPLHSASCIYALGGFFAAIAPIGFAISFLFASSRFSAEFDAHSY